MAKHFSILFFGFVLGFIRVGVGFGAEPSKKDKERLRVVLPAPHVRGSTEDEEKEKFEDFSKEEIEEAINSREFEFIEPIPTVSDSTELLDIKIPLQDATLERYPYVGFFRQQKDDLEDLLVWFRTHILKHYNFSYVFHDDDDLSLHHRILDNLEKYLVHEKGDLKINFLSKGIYAFEQARDDKKFKVMTFGKGNREGRVFLIRLYMQIDPVTKEEIKYLPEIYLHILEPPPPLIERVYEAMVSTQARAQSILKPLANIVADKCGKAWTHCSGFMSQHWMNFRYDPTIRPYIDGLPSMPSFSSLLRPSSVSYSRRQPNAVSATTTTSAEDDSAGDMDWQTED